MRAFIVVAFLGLGLAYWQMSGGAGFEPEAWPEPWPEAASAAGEGSGSIPGSTAEPVPEPVPVAAELVTRAEPLTDDLAALAPAADVPDAPEALAAPTAPEGATLPAEPLAAGEALAAIAPDLAAEAAPLPADAPAAQVTASSAGAAPGSGADLRRVTGDLVNVREGPGTDFGVVGQLAGGEVAEVLEAEGSWLRVRSPSGEGWMAARFLAPAG